LQLGKNEWLGDEIVGPQLERTNLFFRSAMSGEHNDGNVADVDVLLDLTQNLEPVPSWKSQVQYDNIEVLPFDEMERVLPIFDTSDEMVRQAGANGARDIGLVLH
jgi:hypothetical protein